ncbi:acylphosphatase [Halomonas sp. NyZ770]|uniref:acylphosphatase n=1 Tax=Halomonas sp. NyZ770 TaxID=2883106 RepID=UPI001D0AD662|nr:acylphosphatase [Halomonas sp. NyZ770]UDM08503.1 acylphosphatase [Halomonas sp. NyZ770]
MAQAMMNEHDVSLFESVKSCNVHSSSLCCHAIMASALARDVKVYIYSAEEIKKICATYGLKFRQSYYGVGQVFSLTYGDKTYLVNKTKFLLSKLPPAFSKKALKDSEHLGVDSPKGVFFKKNQFSSKLLEKNGIKFPVVLKPVGGSMGKGVVLDLKSISTLKVAIENSVSDDLVVEEQVSGDEYRIYLVKGKYFGAVKRVPANVVGNGVMTVEQLIKQKNALKKKKHHPLIKKESALAFLSAQGKSVDVVPADGEFVALTNVLGRSSGGDVYDVSHQMPGWVLKKIDKLGSYFNDSLCTGLDVIVNEESCYLIEANNRPQLSSLLMPDDGKGRNIADALVSALFPATQIKYVVGGRIGDIKKSVNLSRKNDTGILLDPGVNRFPLTSDSVNDLKFKELSSFSNSNRLVLRREIHSRGLFFDTWSTEKGSKRWSITSAQRSIVFRENMPAQTSYATRALTNDKEKTKQRLSKYGIHVPSGIRVKQSDFNTAEKWFDSLGSSPLVVVKPYNGSGGKGVTSGIASKKVMLDALAGLDDDDAVLEEHINGFDYRLFVVGGKFKYAIKRHPAHVVGDGVSTVEMLVNAKNKVRRHNPYTGKYLLALDQAVIERISSKGYAPDSILDAGKVLYLQTIANIGAGGDSEDVTELVHPDFIEIAERVYGAFEKLAFCGLDLITEDISCPSDAQRYAVIEVNANCDLAMHHFPTRGEPRNAAGAILDDLFPESSPAPVIRRQLTICGKVQGVGYRKWFTRQAKLRSISGTVSNQKDGSVVAMVQGSDSAISDLVRAANQGPAKALVSYVNVTDGGSVSVLDNFSIT